MSLRKFRRSSFGIGILLSIVMLYSWFYILPTDQSKTLKNKRKYTLADDVVKLSQLNERTLDQQIQLDNNDGDDNFDVDLETDMDVQSDDSKDEEEYDNNAESAKSSKEPVFIDLRPLFKTTGIGDDILRVEPIKFLTDVKNPCYAVDKGYINVGNINISYALQKNYKIFCLPYAFQAGFPKCGTNDQFFYSVKLQYLWGAVKDGSWRQKEVHFWDNHKCKANMTFHNYTSRYYSDKIVESFKKYGNSPRLDDNEDDQRDMIFIDGTPRYIWHGDDWQQDEGNKGLIAPKVLLPHKLHHILPNAKIYLSLRNPADRLLSDYKFYYHTGNQSAEDFHKKVVAAIGWWNSCTELLQLPIRTCAYGREPADLPLLSFANCADKPKLAQLDETEALCYRQWDSCSNAANRLRVGLYDIYIKDWMELFPKKSFLFIKLEEYFKDPVSVYDNQLLPFLGHPKLTDENKAKLLSREPGNTASSNWKMLPSTRILLDKFYQKSKENLVKLTGEEKFLWQ